MVDQYLVTEDEFLSVVWDDATGELVWTRQNGQQVRVPITSGLFASKATETTVETGRLSAAGLSATIAALSTKVIASPTPPEFPEAGTIWLDTSAVEPGLIARYDASALSLSDGAAMASWGDLVGSRNLAGSATYVAASAKFGGLPAVRFNGTSHKMEHTAAIPSESTVILVAALTSALTTTQVILSTTSATASEQTSLWAQNAETVWKSTPGSGVGSAATSAAPRDALAHVHGQALSASGHLYRVDGATVTQTTAAAFTRGGVRLGASSSGGLFTAYEVAELLVFDRALDATELASYVDSLRTKWGI